MLLPFIPPCTITPAAEVSAVHKSQSHLIEYRIEKPEIDHGYGEGRFDTVLLESRYIDVSSPFITGAIHEESPLLQVANHTMEKRWASTPLGWCLDVDGLLRDLRREQLPRASCLPRRRQPFQGHRHRFFRINAFNINESASFESDEESSRDCGYGVTSVPVFAKHSGLHVSRGPRSKRSADYHGKFTHGSAWESRTREACFHLDLNWSSDH